MEFRRQWMLQEEVGEARRSLIWGGKGHTGRWLLELPAQRQLVVRADDLAVKGQTAQSEYEEQEQLKELWLPFGVGANGPAYLSIS